MSVVTVRIGTDDWHQFDMNIGTTAVDLDAATKILCEIDRDGETDRDKDSVTHASLFTVGVAGGLLKQQFKINLGQIFTDESEHGQRWKMRVTVYDAMYANGSQFETQFNLDLKK